MAAYEEIADTRPRIRRDVLFSRTPTGVLFHNAHGGFNLTTKEAYRFASLIVPHLNGRHRVAEICQGLGEPQRRMVGDLVHALYQRGFARDAGPEQTPEVAPDPQVAERFAAQIDYIDHYVGDAAGRFGRFRGTRVAVLGDDLTARWCALSLVRNGCAEIGVLPGVDRVGNGFGEVEEEAKALTAAGCPVSVNRLGGGDQLDWADLDGYDLVLVTGGPAAPRQIVRLLAAGIPGGRRLLGSWTFGGRAVTGPVMAPDTAGCWVCAALRLGAGADTGAAADLWSSLSPLAPLAPAGPRIGRPLAAMIGNLLGYEVFRLTTGALPAETDGKLIIQDLDSLDVVAEPLLPHPRCPHCAGHDTPSHRPVVLGLPATDELPADGAAEEGAAQAALAELDTRAVLVRPNAGVFTAYTDDAWNQTPLKVSTVGLALGHGVRREVAAFDVHHVAGARLRALYRAAEVYAEHVVPLTGLLGPAQAQASHGRRPLIGPQSLGTASGTWTGSADVPAWGRAHSLLDGSEVLVPAAALRTLGADNRDRAFEATAAGTGAGATEGEAAARGLLSALSYDALRRALRGAPTARVDPEAFPDDAELVFLARSAKNLGLELDLLELAAGSHRAVPVVLARAADPGTGRPVWALGSGLRLRHAVLEAVRDLLGQAQLGRDQGPDGEVDTGDPLIRELDPRALTAGPGAPLDPAPGTDWTTVLDTLRAAGRDVLLAPAGATDLRAGRIEVARVLLTDGAASGAR
ncbi:TOMM precursor leader peptide-binding protein [Kitasatospora sp. NPDC057223]|uniref:TOMM precursor leader peptide-binding protein n=1 Tax=Kitasatospora sp. NPDC057223 TaxID=3346055 RepID=UPI0036453A95